MPDLTPSAWIIAIIAAAATGLAKGGLGGFGMLTVILMAEIFPTKQSTGVVLPMLITADFAAVGFFRKHADWKTVRSLAPPTLLGIALGALLMGRIPDETFRGVIGWIIVAMTALQAARGHFGEGFESVPHSAGFAWAMGAMAGATSMLANAAGPVMAIYLLARGMGKMQLVGTSAWFFCMVNLMKAPFSACLGMMDGAALVLSAILTPVIVIGVLTARWVVGRIPQKLFERLLHLFNLAGASRLILG